MEAAQLEVQGQLTSAINRYEGAIDTLAVTPGIMLGYVLEAASRVVQVLTGSPSAASTYLRSAREAYDAFGAYAKVRRLDDELDRRSEITQRALPSRHAMLPRPSQNAVGTLSSGSSKPSTEDSNASMDLAIALQAVSAWQKQKSPAKVAASLLTILLSSVSP